jgi:creatinine amidohydrolase/Fe(II)-dependent formamide hydrolase-like protein
MLPYGEGGANEIGNIQVHPGTYRIRHTTLRAAVADIGGQLAENRFKWLFVLHGHGAPTHNIAISDACDFVSETFRVTMLNVTSTQWADPAAAAEGEKIFKKHYAPAEREAIGLDIHAGTRETSGMLALAPRHVRKVYRSLPERGGKDFGELRQRAVTPGWEGHLSAPARAKVAYGREVVELSVEQVKGIIVRAVSGENFFGRPRYPDGLIQDPSIVQIVKDALAHEKAFAEKLEQWLKSKGKE